MTPDEQLIRAADDSDCEGVIKALAAGADINAKRFSNHWSAMHLAAHRNDQKLAKLLLDQGANVDALNKRLETPLYVAGHLDMVQLLLSHGASATPVNLYGNTPAEEARLSGRHPSVVEFLRQLEQEHGHAAGAPAPKESHAEDATDRERNRGPRQPGG